MGLTGWSNSKRLKRFCNLNTKNNNGRELKMGSSYHTHRKGKHPLFEDTPY
jgi:hypothetical protein